MHITTLKYKDSAILTDYSADLYSDIGWMCVKHKKLASMKHEAKLDIYVSLKGWILK